MTRAALLIGLLLGGPPLAVAQATVTLLDTTGDVGLDPSIGIAGGTGLIAYRDATNRDLKVAHCSTPTCTSALVSTIDSTGDVSHYAALAVGADGLGIISYYDATQRSLKVAHCSNVDCSAATITVVDAGVFVVGQTAIAIGADGLPLIAYVRDITSGRHLVAAHCSDVACSGSTVTPLLPIASPVGAPLDTAIAIGADGLGLIAYVPGFPTNQHVRMAHCANTGCSALTPGPPAARAVPEGSDVAFTVRPSLLIGADGLGLLSYRRDFPGFPTTIAEYRLRHCADTACTAFTSDVTVPSTLSQGINAPLARGADAKPWFVRLVNQRVRLARCDDASCLTWSESCATVVGGTRALSLAVGADAQPLTAFHASAALDLGIIHAMGTCGPSAVSVADILMSESTGQSFAQVTLDVPSDTAGTVEYSTVPGTALPSVDYVPVSGTLTFEPGFVIGSPLPVYALNDPLDEDHEQYTIVLKNPAGITLGDATAVVTIADDDPLPNLRIDGCQLAEGNSGTTGCEFRASLDVESGRTVTVPFATQDETATAGSDYLAAFGTLTFVPGSLVQSVTVSVVGDLSVEPDETFRLQLGTAVNASVFESQAQGVILDDDAPPLAGIELTHGSAVTADLEAQAGPSADVDFYRLAQPPFTSWEVVVDGVSGDVAPGLLLELLGADHATVLQTASAVGSGGAVSLRFANRLPTQLLSQHLRIRSTGCGTDCGSDDVYRLRTFETTARLARFNNGGTQLTVLLLQNPTAQPVNASVDFWSEAGVRLATQPATLAPFGMLVLPTWTIPPLAQASGSVTITSDAPYGSLTGKAVAVEPLTGFSFDSPLAYKPR